MMPPPPRNVDRLQHGSALATRIEEIEREVGTTSQLIEGEPPGRIGIPLEIWTAPGHMISADDVHKLTTNSDITVLLAIPERDTDGNTRTRMLLHVPYGQLNALRNKFQQFAQHSSGHNPWIANLDSVARAAIPGLWTDNEPLPADNETFWWEFWLLPDPHNLEAFKFLAERFSVALKPEVLQLPERIVMIGSATKSQLENALPLLDCLAELRRARALNLEWTDLSVAEQHELLADNASRVIPPPQDAPSICLLDTGVNRGHPLLDPIFATEDNHTIFGDGDSSDCYPGTGHGTLCAGLAAFGDLRVILNHSEAVSLQHCLEGVRMFDGNRPHEPENYGKVTEQAVGTAETRHATRNRVFTMPISSDGANDGRPSSWSAAVDAIAFGSEEIGEPKRLIILAGGNTSCLNSASFDYPAVNMTESIENPGQAWNALTVGALTHKTIRETDPESRRLREMAPPGGLSPHSRTSVQWDSHWPIKPEIVLEGGNVAISDNSEPHQRNSLDLLSTSKIITGRPLAPFRATSAATALAAKLAAEIRVDYPSLCPETVRGLMVHSARWSDVMLNGTDPHRQGTTAEIQNLLRCYGYGEPNANRARASASNAVTLFREESLRPFKNNGGLNDCHIHTLPIPADLLADPMMGDAIMRITLSYFIAPSPSASNRMPGSRYRYAGCLLRFDTRNANESEDDFIRRVGSIATADDDPEAVTSTARPRINNRRWALGPALRGKGGSLIHDVWRGPAAELMTMDKIAVFPKKGWWSYRSPKRESPWYLCKQRTIRYSLIVSIETMADIPLYTEINNLISVPVST